MSLVFDTVTASSYKKCVPKMIAHEKRTHPEMKPDQAIAVGISKCKKKFGIGDEGAQLLYEMEIAPLQFFHDYTVKVEGSNSSTILKNILKVHVVLATESIQSYHRKEFPPWLRDQIPETLTWLSVFKPYSELKKAIKDIAKLAIVENHPEKIIFLKDSDERIFAWVKNLYADSVKRRICGWAFFGNKSPTYIIDRLKNGDVIGDSIGGMTSFGPGGIFDGRRYLVHQNEIELGHLAILPHSKGRCPDDLCGFNLDSLENALVNLPDKSSMGDDNQKWTKITGDCPKRSQLIFDINLPQETAIPKYEPIKLDDNITIAGEIHMPPEETEKLKLKIAELEKRNSELEDSKTAHKYTELEKKFADEKSRADTLKELSETLTQERDQVKKDLEDANANLAIEKEKTQKIEDDEKEKMVDAICAILDSHVKEDDLKLPIESVRNTYKTLQEAGMFKDQDGTPNEKPTFPKPGEGERGQGSITDEGSDSSDDELPDYATPDSSKLCEELSK